MSMRRRYGQEVLRNHDPLRQRGRMLSYLCIGPGLMYYKINVGKQAAMWCWDGERFYMMGLAPWKY